jgi:DNA-binding MarR family transcriptional regulator
MLKVDTALSEPQVRHERQVLADNLLDELTEWSPRDRMGMFRGWHRGALSLIHLNVLSVLEAQGPLSMGELADGLDVSDASATGIVDRMERRGLVERRHATDDRRLVQVHLLEAGRSVFSDLHARRREHLHRLLQELSDAELAGFLAGLRAMRAARVRVFAASSGPEPSGAGELASGGAANGCAS